MKKVTALVTILLVAFSLGKTVSAEDVIKLPSPDTKGTVPLETTLLKRRSIRRYKDKELTMKQISQLLWAGQGISATLRGLRTAPSAGATYPLELYIVSNKGVFHYIPNGHKMVRKTDKDQRKKLAVAAYGQFYVSQAPIDIVIAAVPQRTERSYGARAERYINMEVGHAAQNIHLEAVALGLGSVPIGAFSDTAVKTILGLPKDQQPLYIIPIGYPD